MDGRDREEIIKEIKYVKINTHTSTQTHTGILWLCLSFLFKLTVLTHAPIFNVNQVIKSTVTVFFTALNLITAPLEN